MVPWCCGYLYCITSFIKASTQALHWCKSWLWHVGDLQWWGSVTMVPSGNRAKCLLSVNHITKIHHHHTLFSTAQKDTATLCKDCEVSYSCKYCPNG